MNAAKAYAEFLDAFEGEDVSRKKTGSMFVKSSSTDGARVAYNPGKVLDKPSRTLERVCLLATIVAQVHVSRLLVTFTSPSGTETKGEACDGCISRGNQEVWYYLISRSILLTVF